MTREELARFDGRNGQPAYVAVGGIIYDVSKSPLWQEGSHEGLHQAGRDLTQQLKNAPHVAAVVERFPSVGRLDEAPTPRASSGNRTWLVLVAAAALILIWLFLR